MSTAKQQYISGFKHEMGGLLMSDKRVVDMPPIRVNANIAMAKKREIETSKEDQKMKLKSVDVRKFIQTKGSPKDHPSRIFETTDSHYKFNRNHSYVKQAYTSL